MKQPVARGFRPEIQALRTIAVLAVVIFHLWPGRMPGGYIGVDVFFVISGFLITGHLLREADATGRIALSQFYSRRIRRLLPASLLVLIVTAAGVLALVDTRLWRDFLGDISASALYFVNWALALDSVDYFNEGGDVSPVQHYWSLSVEEQFYVVWPLLILTIVLLSLRRGKKFRLAIGVAFGVVFVLSFIYSIWISQTAQSFGYFATPSHAWEFALGGLLALRPDVFASARWIAATHVRAALSWFGVAAILVSCFIFDGASLFPGWIALLPVLGTVAVIASGGFGAAWGPFWLMRLRPVQFVGEVSYSLYLWHWPLIVLAVQVADRELALHESIVIFAVSILLAWLTRRFVERPFLEVKSFKRRRVTFGFAAAVTAVVLVVSLVPVWNLDRQAAASIEAGSEALATRDECFGAAALLSGKECEYQLSVNPVIGLDIEKQPVDLVDDTVAGAIDECSPVELEGEECVLGSSDPDAIIALVGDSHADHLLPAMSYGLLEKNWQLRTYTKQSCPAIEPTWRSSGDSMYHENDADCITWRENLMERMAADTEIDVVVISNYSRRYYADPAVSASFASALAVTMDEWSSTGKSVLTMADDPRPAKDAGRCVSNTDVTADCSLERSKALAGDAAPLAVEQAASDSVGLIDLSDAYCDTNRCYTVVGGVLIYRDAHHLTPLFSRSLGPYLEEPISAALRARQ